MRSLRFLRNAPPFNAGEVAGVADETLARGYVQAGIAIYEDPKAVDADPQIGDRLEPKGPRERSAAVGADGAPLPGEAPGRVPDAAELVTDSEGVTGATERATTAGQQPAATTHAGGKGGGKK